MKQLVVFSLLTSFTSFSQTVSDSLKTHALSPVTIEGIRIDQEIHRLEPVRDSYIYSGKNIELN